jgi:hypothetical protein
LYPVRGVGADNVTGEDQPRARVLEAAARGVVAHEIVVILKIQDVAELNQPADIETIVAVRACQIEAAVIPAGGSVVGKQTGACVGVHEDVVHESADLGGALFGEPFLARLRLKFRQLRLHLGDAGTQVLVVGLTGSTEAGARKRQRGGSGHEANSLGQTHS